MPVSSNVSGPRNLIPSSDTGFLTETEPRNRFMFDIVGKYLLF